MYLITCKKPFQSVVSGDNYAGRVRECFQKWQFCVLWTLLEIKQPGCAGKLPCPCSEAWGGNFWNIFQSRAVKPNNESQVHTGFHCAFLISPEEAEGRSSSWIQFYRHLTQTQLQDLTIPRHDCNLYIFIWYIRDNIVYPSLVPLTESHKLLFWQCSTQPNTWLNIQKEGTLAEEESIRPIRDAIQY